MSLSIREGQCEADRKDRVFAARKIKEDAMRKERHYQRLIAENMELKDALRLARNDIEEWVYSKGESPQSTSVMNLIDKLISK